MKVYLVVLDEDEPYDPGRHDILAAMDSRPKADARLNSLLELVDSFEPKHGTPFTMPRYRPEYLNIVEMEVE